MMATSDGAFFDGGSIEAAFDTIKKDKIITMCKTALSQLRPTDTRTKASLFKAISKANHQEQGDLKALLAAALLEKDGRRYLKRREVPEETVSADIPTAGSKRGKFTQQESLGHVDAQAVDQDDSSGPHISAARLEEMLNDDYMKTPSEEDRRKLVSEFIQRTGNEALKTAVCAVCARETAFTKVEKKPLTEIPNPGLLKPSFVRAQHDIYHGMLLEPAGLVDNDHAWICAQCATFLEDERTPTYALVNHMWIGKTPFELNILTLPERILISRYFMVAYIIKLFPKQANAVYWDKTQLHSGLRGNISTYKLNPSLVSPFVDDNTLPPPPKILAATIGITFVTPKGIPEKSLQPLFRVRKQRVRDALRWLKTNNPLYADIVISEANLELLPEDGVPDEIMAGVRHSQDVDAVMRDHEGYVPLDAADEQDFQALDAGLIPADDITNDDESLNNISKSANNSTERKDTGTHCEDDESDIPDRANLPENEEDATQGREDCHEPSVIPLITNGVVDSEGVGIPDHELMSHALHNFARNPEMTLKVQRGSAPVNEYQRIDPETRKPYRGTIANPNHLLGCFPVLFPYGQGGLETDRTTKVSYEGHVRWCLEYHDKRFRLDPHFIFQVFGVIQKRQVCRSAVLQIQKSAFVTHKEAIASLTPKELERASEEEARNLPYSNQAVRVLRQHLKAIRTRVDGTDESRHSIRSEIWGTILVFNAPSLWITINPSDTQDPIAQVISGAAIDLDKFCKTAGPNHQERSQNIARDPYAAAKYFHFIVNTLLEVVFGFKKGGNGRHSREPGAFGIIQAYVGTMEAQQRGTLHVHMLVWSKDTPNTEDIRAALQHPAYRSKLKEFIRNTVKADIDEKPVEQVREIPKEAAVSYSRPIDPLQHPATAKAAERNLVRALQFHTCTQVSCLTRKKDDKLVCKRGAPFALAITEWINSKGEWGPKRFCGYLNNWNEVLMLCGRCNHDVKLIVNGGETCVLVLYTGNYATKKQGRATNTAALLASRIANHRLQQTVAADILDNNRLLFERFANALFTQKEFSGPEIVCYLMGWGDKFQSHHYTPIYWDSAVNALCTMYPRLRSNSSYTETTESHGIITAIDGDIRLKSQMSDYEQRNDDLEDFCYYDFCIDTYETRMTEKDLKPATENESTRGRPRSQRYPYRTGASKPKMARLIRNENHEMLPRIVGQWVPRQDDRSTRELYAACILLLFQPWRSLNTLKTPTQSFSNRLEHFMGKCSAKHRKIINNFQYYHDCWDIASRRRDALKEGKAYPLFDYEPALLDAAMQETAGEAQDAVDIDQPITITEDMIEANRLSQKPVNDIIFAEEAMQKAYASSVFPAETSNRKIDAPIQRRATAGELQCFDMWDKQLKTATRAMYDDTGVVDLSPGAPAAEPAISNHTMHHQPSVQTTGDGALAPAPTTPLQIISRPNRELLYDDQRLVHDIIEKRLLDELQGSVRDPLHMLLQGSGGTGKSMLIGAITETFAHHDQLLSLAKCGSSGIAACDIGGATVHSWAGLGINNPRNDKWLHKPSQKMEEQRKKNIGKKKLVIIDEISMVTNSIFANLAGVCTVTKCKLGECETEVDFGGMHVVLFGDFHQFPPVANEKAALYCIPLSSQRSACLGRELFLRFTDVFIFRKQMRVQDQIWADILDRLRVGACTSADIDEVKKLVLTSPLCDVPDFTATPWDNAVLITTRHTVREAWNSAVLRRFARAHNRVIYVAPAEDTLKDGTAPSMESRYQIAGMSQKKTGKLADRIELAIGMKAMVLYNMATEADIANGTRGTIEDIILDTRESSTLEPNDEGIVHLKYPPVLILFKPDKGCKLSFKGDTKSGVGDIPQGLVPLRPSAGGFSVPSLDKKTNVNIVRRQYSLTAAYAFTDFKSQGQTIAYVVIDLRKPPTGRMSPFNVYVALSRSRGRGTIRLLDDFDVTLFTNHPSTELAADMIRLEGLDRATRAKYSTLM